MVEIFPVEFFSRQFIIIITIHCYIFPYTSTGTTSSDRAGTGYAVGTSGDGGGFTL